MRDPVFFRRFDYDRNLLPNPWLRQMEEGVYDIATARTRTGGTIGYPGWGVIYHVLLSHLHWDTPSNVVETGTNRGATTIVLAEAVRASRGGGCVHTVEIDQAIAASARDNLARAGVAGLVTLHVGDSRQVLAELLPTLPSVTAAFLDGSHNHDVVVQEFELVLSKLEPGGLVLFDNTYPITEPEKNEDPGVAGALRTVRTRYGGNLVNLERVSWYIPGLAIWQREP